MALGRLAVVAASWRTWKAKTHWVVVEAEIDGAARALGYKKSQLTWPDSLT